MYTKWLWNVKALNVGKIRLSPSLLKQLSHRDWIPLAEQLKRCLAEGSNIYSSSSPNFSSKNPNKPAEAGKISSPLRKFLLLSDFCLCTPLIKASFPSRNRGRQGILLFIVTPSNSHHRGHSYTSSKDWAPSCAGLQQALHTCFLTSTYHIPTALLLLSRFHK